MITRPELYSALFSLYLNRTEENIIEATLWKAEFKSLLLSSYELCKREIIQKGSPI